MQIYNLLMESVGLSPTLVAAKSITVVIDHAEEPTHIRNYLVNNIIKALH